MKIKFKTHETAETKIAMNHLNELNQMTEKSYPSIFFSREQKLKTQS